MRKRREAKNTLISYTEPILFLAKSNMILNFKIVQKVGRVTDTTVREQKHLLKNFMFLSVNMLLLLDSSLVTVGNY